MKLVLALQRRFAAAAEVDTALARLGHAPGMYFGVDAGIEALHPRQAVLLDTPALTLKVKGAGLLRAARLRQSIACRVISIGCRCPELPWQAPMTFAKRVGSTAFDLRPRRTM